MYPNTGKKKHLLRGRGRRADEVPLLESLQHVECAADNGSHENRLLLLILQAFGSAFTQRNRCISPQDVKVTITLPGMLSGDRIVTLSSAALSEQYCIGTYEIPLRIAKAPNLSSASRRILTLASNWLDKCNGEHEKCAVTDPSFLPRRVINVGDHDRSPHLDNSVVQGVRYAALSYCWGSVKDTLVTKRQNIEQHSKSISFKALPKTIQDAIVVCRCLNIQYLWVDALCIVQDDINGQDWYEQSLQMGAIYSQAHVVISAEAATACTDGFLPRENWTDWRVIQMSGLESASKQLYVGRRTGQSKTHAGSMRASALSQRGWTMQECYLPHRILHFAKEEIIWECNVTSVCECGNASKHEFWKGAAFSLVNRWTSPSTNVDQEHIIDITDYLHGSTTEGLCWIWERLVEQYTLRTLTVDDDKLPAISGLARFIQSRLSVGSDNYVAGIWKASLLVGLLWFVTGKPMPSRPTKWRAPSWSWASIDGGIGYFHERHQFKFEPSVSILDCSCVPSSVDDLGKVGQGWIRLRGSMVPVRMAVETTESSTPYKGHYKGFNGRPPRAYDDIVVRVQRGEGKCYEVLLDMGLEDVAHAEDCYCLEIGRTTGGTWKVGQRRSWLVLRRCRNTHEQHPGSAAYKRIGMGILDSGWDTEMDLFPQGRLREESLIEVLLL